ncbi:unnamed protein product [Rotaria sordida]|nr:unnamed protein product [Rotaria sordida]
MHFDDTLDVAIIHGCGGILGAFMTGLFPQKSINPLHGNDGAFYGRPIQIWYQIAGILTAAGFAAACTAGILYPLDWIMGIRLAEEDELEGLDLTEHGENWEIAASRAIGDLVQAILHEQNNGKEEGRHSGTFELRYKPKNSNEKGFKIRLLKQRESRKAQRDSNPANNYQVEQSFNETNIDNTETHL